MGASKYEMFILYRRLLQQKFSLIIKDDNWINGSICPDNNLVNAIKSLKDNQCLKHNDTLIAYRVKESIQAIL